MPATTKHFVCWMGETFKRRLTLVDSAGAAVSLTGCTAMMQVRASVGGTVIFDLTSSSGITLGGAAGTIDIQISAASTAAASVAALTSATVVDHIKSDGVEMSGTGPTGVWGIEITWTDASVTREAEGNFCFVAERVQAVVP